MKRSYLKRTAFKKRVHVDAAQNHALQQTRKAALRSLKAGRRMKEWARVWAWLKPRLEAAGRTRCEFDFIPHECSLILDPCHSKKRREMNAPIDIYTVAIGCRTVHRILDETMGHADMEAAVCRAVLNHGGLILPERKAA